MKVEIQAGSVSSCGASKPVFKHLCDFNHLFLCLFFVSFPARVASLRRWKGSAIVQLIPALVFALLLPPSRSPPASYPDMSFRDPKTPFFQGAHQDGCSCILAVVQHLGMCSVPCSAAAVSLAGCWLKLSSTCGLPGQEIFNYLS